MLLFWFDYVSGYICVSIHVIKYWSEGKGRVSHLDLPMWWKKKPFCLHENAKLVSRWISKPYIRLGPMNFEACNKGFKFAFYYLLHRRWPAIWEPQMTNLKHPSYMAWRFMRSVVTWMHPDFHSLGWQLAQTVLRHGCICDWFQGELH